MQTNFFADEKNMILLLDWINKKYDNHRMIIDENLVSNKGEYPHDSHIIFKDACTTSDFEEYVREKVQNKSLRYEIELSFYPSENILYDLDDPTDYFFHCYGPGPATQARVYLSSWTSGEADFQVKKRHYNEISRFIIRNSIVYKVFLNYKGEERKYVFYLLNLEKKGVNGNVKERIFYK